MVEMWRTPEYNRLDNEFFLNCYLAAPWPTLSYCSGGSLTNPMLITAFLS